MPSMIGFIQSPELPNLDRLPKYLPDLQEENRGRTPHAGWYQNEFLPWIQIQDPKKHDGFTIGTFLFTDKFGIYYLAL